jgi:hypothetical protein
MKAKGVILLLMLATVSFSQDKVNISGTVKDSRTSKPISGASVRLSLLELTATTDSDGNFNILKTSIRQNRKSDISKNPAKESRAVFFRPEVKGPALVQIFDLSGRHQKTLFSGTLESGSCPDNSSTAITRCLLLCI